MQHALVRIGRQVSELIKSIPVPVGEPQVAIHPAPGSGELRAAFVFFLLALKNHPVPGGMPRGLAIVFLRQPYSARKALLIAAISAHRVHIIKSIATLLVESDRPIHTPIHTAAFGHTQHNSIKQAIANTVLSPLEVIVPAGLRKNVSCKE